MGMVIVDLSISLGRGGEHLFTWMGAGPASTRSGSNPIPLEQTRVIVRD